MLIQPLRRCFKNTYGNTYQPNWIRSGQSPRATKDVRSRARYVTPANGCFNTPSTNLVKNQFKKPDEFVFLFLAYGQIGVSGKIVTNRTYHLSGSVLSVEEDESESRSASALFEAGRSNVWKVTMTIYAEGQKLLVNVDEAASMLSVSKGTVYKLIKEGRITPAYVTSNIRISISALNLFVEQLEAAQRTMQKSFGRES